MTTAGRKRSFDKDEALDKAMRVFWANGYTGTSLNDLTTALDINKPSLYAAFGNKEQLFHAALDHYIQHYGAPILKHLSEPEDMAFPQRLENYLLAVVGFNCNEASPSGCFVVNSCCESDGTGMPKDFSTVMQDVGNNFEQVLSDLLRSEQQKGQLRKDLNVKQMAAYILSFVYGLAVMARRGKTRKELRSIVKAAIKTMELQN